MVFFRQDNGINLDFIQLAIKLFFPEVNSYDTG